MFETKEGTIKPIVYVGIVKSDKLLLVDYKHAPNPTKKGWWIPAPGLKFGEDFLEVAKSVVKNLGFSSDKLKLHSIETFTTPGGWHLINHFVCHVREDPKSNPEIERYKWVTIDELEQMKDIAHGKWEIGVGCSYLKAQDFNS